MTTNTAAGAVTAATIGTTFKWFDFSLHGTVNDELAEDVFADDGSTSPLRTFLAMFGVALVARALAPSFAVTSKNDRLAATLEGPAWRS